MPPKSSSDEPPIVANGMSLRGHRSKNVGAPDMKRLRRPNGEAAAERTEKAQTKVSNDKIKKQGLRKVAMVEQAAKLADKENHHRPSLPARSKVIRDAEEHVPDSDDERKREKEEKNAEKKAKKRLTRRFIEEERATMDSVNSGNAPIKIKRKADKAAAESSAKKAKTGKNPIGGLRPDWLIKDNVPPQATHAHVNDQDFDCQCEPIGGISDDNNISGERAALDINPTGPRYKSLAKVNLTPVVPIPQLSGKHQQTLLRKKKITRNDIPDGIRREFYDKYILYAIRLAGFKDAWYNPTHNDTYQSWVAVLAHSDSGYGQPDSKYISVAEKLINNTLSQVRNRMKEAAVKALDILLRNEEKNSIEERKDYVKWLQGGGLQDSAPPFYFKVYNVGPGVSKRKGPFQSFLIAFTFSLHVAAISGVPDDGQATDGVIKQPGALVMAVQAVKRAIFYYRSGVKEEPNPRDTLSHFSHSNWADHNEILIDDCGESTTTLIPTMTSIKNLVDQLKPSQWAKINQEAAQFIAKETGPPSPVATVGTYNENPKLIDDDSDDDDPQQQGPAPYGTDFNQSQASGSEWGAPAPDNLLDFDDGDMAMEGATDNKEESVTESDSEMPDVAPSTIKWVRWEGDSDSAAVESDSVHESGSDLDKEHE